MFSSYFMTTYYTFAILFQAIQNLVNNCTHSGVTGVTESAIGQETAGIRGHSRPNQTKADLLLPTPGTTVEQEDQAQMELTTQDENPTEYIYQVSNDAYEYELGLISNPTVKGSLKRHIQFWQNIGTSIRYHLMLSLLRF